MGLAPGTARIVGHKKAREIWYLCRQYDAQEALGMGLVNEVVPVDGWRRRAEMGGGSFGQKPLAIRCLKSAFNADCDGQAGIQELAGNATLLYYLSEEGAEGKKAFWKKDRLTFRNILGYPEIMQIYLFQNGKQEGPFGLPRIAARLFR